jgi:hypothetical protein
VRLLAAASSGPLDTPPVSGLTLGALTRLADGLGDIITALQTCGALSPLSPVPGQLAALCADLNVNGHGIAAPSVRDLPEPWLSLLACYRRRKTGATPARDGCAAAAVMLPEVDGIRLAILGLHNCQDSTVVHMHASGPRSEVIYGPHELYAWATIWVRDDGGHCTPPAPSAAAGRIARWRCAWKWCRRLAGPPPGSRCSPPGNRLKSEPHCRFAGTVYLAGSQSEYTASIMRRRADLAG